ncbi:Dihydroxyacetone phosphatase [Balamuthia mandrillaris]
MVLLLRVVLWWLQLCCTGLMCGMLLPSSSPLQLSPFHKAYGPIICSAMDRLGSKDTIIIGDRMDTDIIAGIASGIDTCLVLTGVTSIPQLRNFAYAPKFVLEGVSSVPPSLS